MAWDFETDPEFQEQLEWIDEFVREEIEPLDFIITSPYDLTDPVRNDIIKPLQAQVQERELWACLLYTSPSPRDRTRSRMPSSA